MSRKTDIFALERYGEYEYKTLEAMEQLAKCHCYEFSRTARRRIRRCFIAGMSVKEAAKVSLLEENEDREAREYLDRMGVVICA